MRKAVRCVGVALVLVTSVGHAWQGAKRSRDQAVVDQTIRDSIGWALTKDRPLLERIITHDADLFIFHPDSKSTVVGWDAFAKNFTIWMDLVQGDEFRCARSARHVRAVRRRVLVLGISTTREWDGKPSVEGRRWTACSKDAAGSG